MQTFHIPNGDDCEDCDDDDGGDSDDGPLMYPARVFVVSRAEAIRRLEAALPVYERLTGETWLARSYWSQAVACLRALPFALIVLDASEILDLHDEEDGPRDLSMAMGGDAAALPYLKQFADYQPGAAPYPVDVHRSVPYGRDEDRNHNTVALDPAFGSLRQFPPGVAESACIELDLPRDPDWCALRDLMEELRTLLSAEVSSSEVYYGIVQPGSSFLARLKRRLAPPAPVGLKLLVTAETEAEVAALVDSANVRAQLDGRVGRMSAQLRTICARYGFEWQGAVFVPAPVLESMFEDEAQWTAMAPTPPFAPGRA